MVEESVGLASSRPWVADTQGTVRFGIVGGPMGDWHNLARFRADGGGPGPRFFLALGSPAAHARLLDHADSRRGQHARLRLGSLLAESPAALALKRERVPPQLLAFVRAGALVGTPEQAVERLQPLVSAGCQYFTFAVLDPDTLRLLAELFAQTQRHAEEAQRVELVERLVEQHGSLQHLRRQDA